MSGVYFPQCQNLPEFNASQNPTSQEMLFVPLGGTREIGMNLNLYGHDGQWLGVDFGITFTENNSYGVDIVLPDPSFLEALGDKFLGFFITHAHEDHLGALAYLWDSFSAPVFASPFTYKVIESKLRRENIDPQDRLRSVDLNGSFQLGGFNLQLITLTHSIPEPNAVVLRTKAGVVFHTGDWKIDPDPQIGEKVDAAALLKVGNDGVDVLVCDSTNALEQGWSCSEGFVYDALQDVLKDLTGSVVITCFASNIARLQTIAKIARAIGRKPILVGQSLVKMVNFARQTGYLQGVDHFFEPHQIHNIAREERLILCTGSQGEPRAALARIVRKQHPDIQLQAGDHVVFSSRVIPGNETRVSHLQNSLAEQQIITHVSEICPGIHASGHPNRDELSQMYQWIRPNIAVPVHGEMRHLMGHAQLALDHQVKQAIIPFNGGVFRICGSKIEAIGRVHAGRLLCDGNAIIPEGSEVLRERRILACEGVAFIGIAGLIQNDISLHIQVLGIALSIEELQELEKLALKQAIYLYDTISKLENFCSNMSKWLAREIKSRVGKRVKIIATAPELLQM